MATAEPVNRLIGARFHRLTGGQLGSASPQALTLGLGEARPWAPVLAAAIEQVLTATSDDPEYPSLGGVRFEVSEGVLSLTATDRHRLATRTLVSDLPATWAGTPAGDYPDHRALLAGLTEPTTRVTVDRLALLALLAVLENTAGDELTLRVTQQQVSVQDVPVPAQVTGAELEIVFGLTILYPAVSSAFGPDVMLDLRGPAQAATVRSAGHGDLTTIVMPIRVDATV